MSPKRIVWALAGALTSLPLAAQNLVLNAGFDQDTSSWGHPASISTLAWSMSDANSNPNSGSAQLVNIHPNPSNGVTVTQCIPMPQRWAYRFSGKAMVPSGEGQLLSNSTRVDIRFSGNAECTQFSAGSISLGTAVNQFDTWQNFGPVVRTAPIGTMAVQIRGLITKFPAGGSATAHFDDFIVEPDTLFIGGFE